MTETPQLPIEIDATKVVDFIALTGFEARHVRKVTLEPGKVTVEAVAFDQQGNPRTQHGDLIFAEVVYDIVVSEEAASVGDDGGAEVRDAAAAIPADETGADSGDAGAGEPVSDLGTDS